MTKYFDILTRKPIYYLYLHRVLNEFADSLIKVFVPVVIYDKTASITAVIWFVLSYYILQSLLNLILRKVLVRSPLSVIVLRLVPVLLLQFLLISDFTQLGIHFYIAALAIVTAFSNCLYWLPLNSLFTMLAAEKTGSKTGQFRAASRVGNMLAPILSGFLIGSFGIASSATLAMLCYILSITALMPLAAHVRSFASEQSKTDSSQSLDSKPIKSTLALFVVLYFIVGIFDTAEMFWSLLIYSVSAKYIFVGLATALIKLGVILANLLTGYLTDAGKWFVPAVVSLILFGILWLTRVYVTDIYWMCLISIAGGFVKPFFLVPTFSKFISFVRHSDRVEDMLMSRELSIKAGGSAAIILGLVLPVTILKAPFIIAGGASICTITLLNKISKLDDTDQIIK